MPERTTESSGSFRKIARILLLITTLAGPLNGQAINKTETTTGKGEPPLLCRSDQSWSDIRKSRQVRLKGS
ncbi:hypothetical protein CEXT_742811 [Caerostris extrusa]|uniref:Uncharacterized protein n=1 Tax=Caerostris extrusa TaxID=172846 RepID=A0AAV4T8X3_CAEEX|nr:hypothetical protein CEXT_742811 [Caerostris extrusa]